MIIRTARDAAALLEPLFDEAEKLVVLHLDSERRMLALDEYAVDSQTTAPLPLRAIMNDALCIGSVGMVIGHNRAAGGPEPSRTDIDATRLLARTAERLGIRVHDHLIFAAGECRSFRELGLL